MLAQILRLEFFLVLGMIASTIFLASRWRVADERGVLHPLPGWVRVLLVVGPTAAVSLALLAVSAFTPRSFEEHVACAIFREAPYCAAPSVTSDGSACQRLAAIGMTCSAAGLVDAVTANNRAAIDLFVAAGFDASSPVQSLGANHGRVIDHIPPMAPASRDLVLRTLAEHPDLPSSMSCSRDASTLWVFGLAFDPAVERRAQCAVINEHSCSETLRREAEATRGAIEDRREQLLPNERHRYEVLARGYDDEQRRGGRVAIYSTYVDLGIIEDSCPVEYFTNDSGRHRWYGACESETERRSAPAFRRRFPALESWLEHVEFDRRIGMVEIPRWSTAQFPSLRRRADTMTAAELLEEVEAKQRTCR